MMKDLNRIYGLCVLLLVPVVLAGCSQSVEVARKVWGSSTRTLENERVRAVRDVYRCEYDECYNLVRNLGILSDGGKKTDGPYKIFQENYKNGVVVVMGVPGNVDTTEVGIFLFRVKVDETSVEVTSLSRSAKRKVAEAIRQEMLARGFQ
jgi:hypothetical protein